MDENNKEFGLTEYMAQEGRLLIRTPRFNLDTFPALAEQLLKLLSAQVVEKQWDGDVHSWLVDFEETHLFLKAEHYSEAVWFESLTVDDNREVMDYLAQLFAKGF
ncbi:TPA: DUF3630 family protein [Vibrio vulnificus]|uniref:DUF3630 family protein n=1 Tax=Vibrio vulnificus TaxID=672 RepID=UPI0009287E20|nr:DUF3630 family protein [Vibrio vulnificus]NIG84160.1 DUF3630 family protein [Lacticaseibacillus casei]EHT4943247.1 DUF3630 family protein [Vibrio vulnificus]MBN8142815.1 DUF3630 family protein [Vibrio vulnificus]MBN8152091.1 DUF3630 family protein [Vibrio vulnificus]MDS1872873.1 DUF3630 family protein [Vibrio vulnificus]